MKILTIFTPTYNRAYTLHLCYESLIRQTCSDFEWLIIDDGSVDNTKELVESWISENKIPIRYFYKPNGGMHTAHNAAYRLMETELNVCIDSDDYMTDDAVELIVNKWKRDGSSKYAGIVGLDTTFDGKILGIGKFPDDWQATTLENYRTKGYNADHKLVYRTDIMKRLPEYPVFENEKLVPLSYKYLLCDLEYELLILNEPLCRVEYQEDGSSKNIVSQYFRSPRGFAFYRNAVMLYHPSSKTRCISAMHYISSNIIIRNKRFLSESSKKWMSVLALPFGILLYVYLRYRNIKMNKITV